MPLLVKLEGWWHLKEAVVLLTSYIRLVAFVVIPEQRFKLLGNSDVGTRGVKRLL